MRITVVPSDGRVNIDGEGYNGIDLSSLDTAIHAVQWYDTEGEIEIKDSRGRIVENREITSFNQFEFVIPLWEAAKTKYIEDKIAAKTEQDLQVQTQQFLPQ